jgi:hypothetical protein
MPGPIPLRNMLPSKAQAKSLKGRRTEPYSEEMAIKLLEHISSGKSQKSFSYNSDGTRIEGHPQTTTIYQWLAAIPGFKELYETAKQERAHSLVDEICDIADNDPDPKRARNRIDARKWAASKFLPRIYGDKTVLVGEDGAAPIKFEGRSATKLSDQELESIALKGLPTKD